MGKGLLIIILGSVVMLSVMNMSLVKTINSGTDSALDYYENTQARNKSNSMVNILLSRIADNPDYRTSGSDYESFFDESVHYRAVDTTLDAGKNVIKIETVVEYNGYPKKTTTLLDAYTINGWVPPPLRAAWTAHSDLNNTISDMVIDGRNHDLELNIVPNSGTMGVSSSVDFINEEKAAIGGTHNGIDYETKNPEDQEIIEEFYNWNGAFPDNPDEILGYPEGTLKSIAQSGAGGSQYLLNPNAGDIDEKVLDFPLKGVTYIELTDGDDRQLRMKGNGNSGIVVVHGPNASSRLSGVKMEELKAGKNETLVCHSWNQVNERTMVINQDALADHLAHGDIQESCGGNHTWFEGMIVTDYSFHHHLDILGAILQLSPDLEMSKDCNGNADHWIKYSTEAVETATKFAAEQSSMQGNNPNFKKFSRKGFGSGRIKAASWYE